MATTVKKTLTMIPGSHYIPKDDPGEDAHFFDVEHQVIGVADGVGGLGTDSGIYARLLMKNAADILAENGLSSGSKLKPLLNDAFLKTVWKGASTACFVSLRGATLHAVNLGDSGFVLIRGEGTGKVVYRSPIQQYSMNHPYQIGQVSLPDATPDALAEHVSVPVKCGDVVVVATDGLFDNLFDEQIEDVVQQGLKMGRSPEELAVTLATAARRNALNGRKKSPFQVAANEAGISFRGGKCDDITVVVGYIRKPEVKSVSKTDNKKLKNKKKGH